jgi:hypothetical protein
MGFPFLRCYKGYYPREWYRYHFSPWWYRSGEHLYSADRCPPYYYYDQTCGCCRYYLNNPDLTRVPERGAARSAVTSNASDTVQDRVSVSASQSSWIIVRPPKTVENRPPGTPVPPESGKVFSGQLQAGRDTLAGSQAGDTTAAGTHPADSAADSTVVKLQTKTDTVPAAPPERQRRRSMRSR